MEINSQTAVGEQLILTAKQKQLLIMQVGWKCMAIWENTAWKYADVSPHYRRN